MADDTLLSHQQQQEDGNLWDGEYPLISPGLIPNDAAEFGYRHVRLNSHLKNSSFRTIGLHSQS